VIIGAFVARSHLRDLASLAAFPALEAGDVRIEAGEEGWDRIIGQSTPADRATIVNVLAPWFTAELIATRPACERLRHWFALSRPPLSRRAVARDVIALSFDVSARVALVSALRKMPPPVVHYVITHAWFIAIHRELRGWTWQAPPYPLEALHLIALDTTEPQELYGLAAHEVAHAWLLPSCPPESVPTIRERMESRALPRRLAERWHRHDLIASLIRQDVREAERDERQAAALARSWGFVSDVTDPERCAAATRVAMLRATR
jgi:hypothetical protein